MAVTGQVPSSLIGTDGFQEADISGITIPITERNFLVTKPEDIARTIGEAFHVASTGRPGPVLVDIAKDAMQAMTDFSWPVPFELPGYHPVTRPHARQVREAARLITESRRPVLYVGGGVIKARAATAQLRELAELTGIPVVTTLMARGAFPDRHPLHMGDARHARYRHGGRRAAAGRPDHRAGHQVRRPGDRQAGHVRPPAR